MAFLHFHTGNTLVLRQHLTSACYVMSDERLDGDLLVEPADGEAVYACVSQLGDGRFQLEDQTGVGLQVNGVSMKARILQHQDTFKVGHFSVEFVEPPNERGATTSRLGEVLPQGGARMVLRLNDGQDLRITASGIKVGRDETNDVVLVDGTVSGLHATIYQKNNTTVVRDLGSTNGTFVNDVRVLEVLAQAGDVVRFGGVNARLVDTNSVPSGARSIGGLVYASAKMEDVARAITLYAKETLPVWITGESGTGKELVAQALHLLSQRRAMPFNAVNCAALASSLMDSELFGHQRGAFTGALADHVGHFERAGNGTVFLDEIASLSADGQAKILRVLEERKIRRVGDVELRDIGCRIIVATHQDLNADVANGAFRNDLLHRVAALVIEIPPLRARLEDLEVLVPHLLASAEKPKEVTGAAMSALRAHPWTGNVRELRNVLLSAAIRAQGAAIDVRHLQLKAPAPKAAKRKITFVPRTLAQIEAEGIARTLEAVGNKSEAARVLDISRTTLREKMVRSDPDKPR